MSDEYEEKAYTKLPVTIRARRMRRLFEVTTLEGVMRGGPGDWLITGVEGEQYPCADSVFRKTYRRARGGELTAEFVQGFRLACDEIESTGRVLDAMRRELGGPLLVDAPQSAKSKPSHVETAVAITRNALAYQMQAHPEWLGALGEGEGAT